MNARLTARLNANLDTLTTLAKNTHGEGYQVCVVQRPDFLFYTLVRGEETITLLGYNLREAKARLAALKIG